MTAHVWPIDNVSNTGRALRQTALAAGLVMADPARPLGGVSGVRPGTPSSIGSVTSTQWTVNPFGGTIDGEALAIAGPYAYSFETAQTGGVTAAGAAARTDRLDVQISDPAEGDGSSTPGVQIVYTQGSTTTPPTAPARTHPLFLINVPVSGTPTLTWNASFTASAGGAVQFLTLAALNLWTTAGKFQKAQVTADPTAANNGDYAYSGTAWVATHLTVGASVKRSNSTATFSSGVWTQLTNATYWATDQPVSGMNAFNGTFVAPIAGLYEVRLGIQLDSAVNAILCLKKNDSTASSTGNIASVSVSGFASDTAGGVSKLIRLNAGDYVAGAIFVSAAAVWNTTAPDASFFSIRYVEPLR